MLKYEPYLDSGFVKTMINDTKKLSKMMAGSAITSYSHGIYDGQLIILKALLKALEGCQK